MAFIPFAQREEWKDVTPIPQDEGSAPVVPIAYSAEFVETMGYFRAVLQANERSLRAFDLTEEVIELNEANYTVWHYRRLLLDSVEPKVSLEDEMAYVADLLAANPKSYQLWFHRQALVERTGDPSLEKDFTKMAIEEDSKNYHAWAYRQWLLKRFENWEGELAYTEDLIEEDCRNNSAWNHRVFVLSNTGGWTPAELKFAFKYCLTTPHNECPWVFLRACIKNLPDPRGAQRDILVFCEQMKGTYPKCTHLYGLVADVLEMQVVEGDSEAAPKVFEVIGELINIDPMRRHYWNFRLNNVGKTTPTPRATQ